MLLARCGEVAKHAGKVSSRLGSNFKKIQNSKCVQNFKISCTDAAHRVVVHFLLVYMRCIVQPCSRVTLNMVVGTFKAMIQEQLLPPDNLPNLIFLMTFVVSILKTIQLYRSDAIIWFILFLYSRRHFLRRYSHSHDLSTILPKHDVHVCKLQLAESPFQRSLRASTCYLHRRNPGSCSEILGEENSKSSLGAE